MLFDIYKTLDLGYLGDAWKECYLKFRPFNVSELQKLSGIDPENNKEEATQKAIDLLKEKFVEGKAVSNKEVVDIKAEDLTEFPVEVILDAIKLLSEGLDKKKENPSTTP